MPSEAVRSLRDWSIAFYGDAKTPLGRLIFRPGFRHVTAFAWVSSGVWAQFDPRTDRFAVQTMCEKVYTQKRRAIERSGGVIVKLNWGGGARGYPWPTCAGLVAHLIGLKKGALRPYPLYRHLARQTR